MFEKKNLLPLVLLVLALAQPDARATSAPMVSDQKVCTGSAAASNGTFTCDYATTTDRGSRLVANVSYSNFSAAHLVNAAFITCEYVVANKNGTVAAVPTYSTSINPANSSNLLTSRAMAADSAFVNSGGGQYPACAWSISGTNARVTITNPSVTSVAADVTVWIQAFNFGSQ